MAGFDKAGVATGAAARVTGKSSERLEEQHCATLALHLASRRTSAGLRLRALCSRKVMATPGLGFPALAAQSLLMVITPASGSPPILTC